MSETLQERQFRELTEYLNTKDLANYSVTLVPPYIPLACFPEILEGLLSRLLAKEWGQLSERAKYYLNWFSVKAEAVDQLVPKDPDSTTMGFEMLAIDREGRSFGGILEQSKAFGIPSVMIRFASLIAALLTLRLLKQDSKLTPEHLSKLMFTQNVDGDYLNYPMALKLLLSLFPEHEKMLYFEVNEKITSDHVTTIRALSQDLNIRLVLDDSNKMDAAVHWKLIDLADWIKLDFHATKNLEKQLAAGNGEKIIQHFVKYAEELKSAVIVLEGLSEESPLKLFLEKRWNYPETSLYYQSRERRPTPPWDAHFGLIQDYSENEFGLFFKGLIHEENAAQSTTDPHEKAEPSGG